jgi:hypothetical protein
VATTTQENDFDRAKRWGKEFLAAGQAGAGGGTGQGRRRSDPAEGLRGEPKAQDALLAMAGGTAVVLGSLMPWISFNAAGADVNPAAKAASVVLGLVVVALGFALRAAPLPGRLFAGTATLGLSSLAGLLYVGFILAGINGVPEPGAFGDMAATVTYSPNIGIILAVAGCGAAFIGAIRSFHHRQD